jgi:hypothetical protein
MKKKFLIYLTILLTIISSCKKDDSDSTDTPVTGTNTVPAIYSKIYGATSVTSDGTFVYIKATGEPDHKSPYFATSNSNYEAYSGPTFTGVSFSKNPNTLSAQNYTFKIPINPTKASVSAATPLGPIGVALNGVPFFNQYAGPNNQPLTSEIVSFDKYYGHPQQSGQYHYHVEPLYLTTVKATKSSLLGFLLDGFPVYGPTENGVAVQNSSLDANHGHTHITADYPNGIYHYHITDADPYLNGSGFYGTAGTVTR